MKILKLAFLVLLFWSASTPSNAQVSEEPIISIKGKIVTNEEGQIIPYLDFQLFSAADTVHVIKDFLIDDKGEFNVRIPVKYQKVLIKPKSNSLASAFHGSNGILGGKKINSFFCKHK